MAFHLHNHWSNQACKKAIVKDLFKKLSLLMLIHYCITFAGSATYHQIPTIHYYYQSLIDATYLIKPHLASDCQCDRLSVYFAIKAILFHHLLCKCYQHHSVVLRFKAKTLFSKRQIKLTIHSSCSRHQVPTRSKMVRLVAFVKTILPQWLEWAFEHIQLSE